MRSASGRAIAEGLVAALLSPCCVVCGEVLDRPLAGPVCAGCWQSLRLITPPICGRCGHPLARASCGRADADRFASCPSAGAACVACRGASSLALARAVGPYEGVLRAVVHAFKYDGRRGLVRPLARLLRERCAEVFDGADAVVPVPLHWRRRWRRGFNQAELLAASLAVPMMRLLRRRRATPAQAALTRGRRRTNLAGAFALRRSIRTSPVAGRVLVLVDDVWTTGATMEGCAGVLREAGAAEVRAVAVARTLMHNA